MVAAYIDPALGVLRAQLWARYAGITIYWIGDPAHAARLSDHNPEADGSVDAIDLMVTTDFTKAQADQLVDTLVRNADWRIKYLIWNRRIWYPASGWETHRGSDPHTDHIHVSRNDVRETNTDPWVITTPQRQVKMLKFSISVPDLKQGDSDANYGGYNMIGRFQRLCGVPADGIWGPVTTAAIERTADVPDGSRMTESIYRKLFGLSS